MKCPCLYSEVAPICRAETVAMHVPSSSHLNRFCVTEHYRRCDLFRQFLTELSETPERWRAVDERGR